MNLEKVRFVGVYYIIILQCTVQINILKKGRHLMLLPLNATRRYSGEAHNTVTAFTALTWIYVPRTASCVNCNIRSCKLELKIAKEIPRGKMVSCRICYWFCTVGITFIFLRLNGKFVRDIKEHIADAGRLFYFLFQLFHELGVANRH
jgi:hypothetical protein